MRSYFRTIRVGELCFWFGMALQFLMTTYLITIQNIPFSKFFVFGIILFFTVKIFVTKYAKREFIWIMVILFIAVFSYLARGDSKILRVALMVIAAKGIPFKKILRFLITAYTSLLLVIPSLCLFRNIGILYIEGTFGIGRAFSRRYMLGFDGPNRLTIIWTCLMSAIILYKEKRSIWRDMLFTVISIAFYELTRSRTGFIADALIIGFPYIYNLGIKWLKKFMLNSMLKWALFFILILTIISTLTHGPLLERFNTLVNNRTAYLSLVYSSEPISLFGSRKNFQIYGGGMDNSYFAIMYTCGIIPLLLYLLGVISCCNAIGRSKNKNDITVAMAFIVIAYVQEMIDIPFINMLLILFMKYWNDMVNKRRQIRRLKNVKNFEMVAQTASARKAVI